MNVAFKSQTATHATAQVVMFAPIAKATPVLTSYHITSDKASSLVRVYSATAVMTTCDAISAGSQAVLSVAATTGFSTDQILIVKATGVMEYHLVASVQAGVSLTTTANLAGATAVGDRVYQLELIASFPCAAATVSNYGGPNGILGAGIHKPLVVVGDSTSAGTIHVASVTYVDGK